MPHRPLLFVSSLLALAVLPAGLASADSLRLTVQPIQVCDDGGTYCANAGRVLFEDATRQIWAQAGIQVDFLGWQVIESTGLLAPSFDELTAPGHGQSADPFAVNVWFVREVSDCAGYGPVAGCGFIGASGIAITEATLGSVQIDILAHELAHNLGLDHVDAPLNLLAPTNLRLVPSGVGDIYPFGRGTSRLTPEQLALAGESPLLRPIGPAAPVPEPSALVLTGLGLAALAARRGRRRAGARRETG